MAITASDIIAIMKEVGIDEKIIKELKYDAPLAAQGIDSIDLPAIHVATEKKYSVSVPVEDSSAMKTLNDYVAFLNTKM